jgi:hypothetical protein
VRRWSKSDKSAKTYQKKNGGPEALTVTRIDGERARSGGESRKTGVWQQLGLKRVRGSMQKQVRAAGAIQLTAQPRQAIEHDPRIMMTCTESPQCAQFGLCLAVLAAMMRCDAMRCARGTLVQTTLVVNQQRRVAVQRLK